MPILTIDLTPTQATRIQQAVGKLLNLSRPATLQESRTFIINQIKDAILRQEKQDAVDAVNTIVPIDIT